jgi:YcaO-like protein with predicted kinase domain
VHAGPLHDTSGWHENGERCIPAAATVDRLRPLLSAFGITRLARQTGLDRLGIPCFSAIRPAGLTLSVSQGKGLDDASAMASALMEAIEYAVAERPRDDARTATATEIRQTGDRFFNPSRLLPPAAPFALGEPVSWIEGRSWPSDGRVWVPLDVVTLGGSPSELREVSRSTNGLASGNRVEEALFHAICELLERDATSLWSLLPDEKKIGTEFVATEVEDAAIRHLLARIAEAGLELRLYDQTTDLGVPCVMAVIKEPPLGSSRTFDLAAGYGCHPVGARATVRAITEAAQTRITNIAGGRDDFLPDEYAEPLDETTRFLDRTTATKAPAPAWLPAGSALPLLMDRLADRVGPMAEIVWSELGDAAHQISVVRALSTTLEDRETNANWSPGRRALRVLAD